MIKVREFKLPPGTDFLIENGEIWYEEEMTDLHGKPAGIHSYFVCPNYEGFPVDLRGDKVLFKMRFFRVDEKAKLDEEALNRLEENIIKFLTNNNIII